jgi:transcriptional regulator NrdR family protein
MLKSMINSELSASQIQQLVADYKSNKPVASIREEYSLDPYHFYKLLREQGVAIGREQVKKALTEQQVEQIVSDYQSSTRVEQILSAYNIGTGVLYRLIKERNVPRRRLPSLAGKAEDIASTN